MVTSLLSQPSHEVEGSPSYPSSNNAPPSSNSITPINAWKKLARGGEATPAVHPVIDPSSWPSLSDSSKKLPEPHSSESPSSTPTPETASPPPIETLPEPASTSSMTTTAASDSDQLSKIAAPMPMPPPPPVVHSRPSRSPVQQRYHHNQRFSSNNQRGGSPFHNNNFINRRQQPRPPEWNSNRRAFVPRNFNHNHHYQYQHQGFRVQPSPMPPHTHPNPVPAVMSPLYYGSPAPHPAMDYMVPSYYFSELPFQDVYRPLYSGPAPYQDPIRGGVVMHTPPFPVYTPQADAEVCNALLQQIEYYFSDVNLETDDYLKAQMDGQGWVSVHLISGFKRVKRLTEDVNLILKALRPSTVVEVQGQKLRKRGNWMAWVPAQSSSSPAHSPQNKLVASMQSLQLDVESGVELKAADSQPVDALPSIFCATAHGDDLAKENPSTKRRGG
ncbi:la-related protein 1B-like [Magnolia sinica]|uniref:la-related protein 1B-like n=1 Tax=Magnolia sinica TaxID=86752 RepID=UPI0026593B35|nr:la-related protein 1B-like [Magnolia sinica]XP_058089890.1 la-related protein 1B-like [Magnolia sinica]